MQRIKPPPQVDSVKHTKKRQEHSPDSYGKHRYATACSGTAQVVTAVKTVEQRQRYITRGKGFDRGGRDL